MSCASPPNAPWLELLPPATGDSPATRIPMRLLSRHGEPLLLLPLERRAAARALDLYPAQTTLARLARAGLRLSLRAGFNFGTSSVDLAPAHDDALLRFLTTTAGKAGSVSEFALLLGNARTPGRRCLALCFDARGNPAVVVKAGATPGARALVDREREFLRSVPRNAPGLPTVVAEHADARVSAFAMQFAGGAGAPPRLDASLAALLSSWVDGDRVVPFRELACWTRLANSGALAQLPERARRKLETSSVCPVLFHGDFAPWNLKRDSGGWTALDWERGELAGPPAWDWFHFLIQSAVLVRRVSAAQFAGEVERVFASGEFRAYSARTKIGGNERELFAACVLHNLRVLNPSEGRASLELLSAHLVTRWFEPNPCT